jgi:putative peptidoglycan lipid II flippase
MAVSATRSRRKERSVGAWRAAPPEPPASASAAVMRNSLAGSVWTVVSRLTGLGKAVVVGAVLGATYLGNTYQSINSLPNLVYYQLLAGSLFASLLVPPLVRYVDEGDHVRAQRFVQGFLGSLLLVAAVVSGILVAAGPVIIRLLTAGVPNRATAAAQGHVGWLLLVMFVPQISLYVIAGAGAAAMNARGRFALAAGAPALESLGMIAVLIAAGVLFGTGTDIAHVPERQLLLLGLGTTSAVGLHAACQWWGARASGLTMIPGAGWRDPEVRQVVRRILPTLGFTGLAALQIFAVMVVANRVQGGFVAFQLALNFFYLPTAVVTWPTARALLPQLSRLHHAGHGRSFRGELLRGVTVASFLTVPIAAAYIALSFPLAHALAFGRLGEGGAWRLMALSLASLAPGVIGETWFILGTYAFYARHDARSPLRSMAIRVGVSLSLMVAAWLSARGAVVLVLLGLSLSAGSLVGAAHIAWRLRARLPRTGFPLLGSLARTMVASLVMVVPAYLTTLAFRGLPRTKPSQLLAMVAATLVGAVVFVGVQAAWRAPELQWLRSGLLRRPPPSGSGPRRGGGV